MLAAVRPLTSFEEAEYLAHEVPDQAHHGVLKAGPGQAPRSGSPAGPSGQVPVRGAVRSYTVIPPTVFPVK